MTGEKESLINAARSVYDSANEISKDIPIKLKYRLFVHYYYIVQYHL